MSEPQSSWAFVGISPEARQAAEAAAEAAGMELDTWLAQLIKYKSTMELKGRAAVPLDAAIMQITAPTNAAAAAARAEEPAPAPEHAPQAGQTTVPDEAFVQTGPATLPDGTEQDGTEQDGTGPDEAEAGEVEADTMPAAEKAASEQPADREQPDHPETVVLPSPEPAPKAPPAARTAVERPRADNDTGPLDETGPLDDAATPPAPAAAGRPAPEDHQEPSPRRNLPTEALRPSRLSALNQASEEAIQGAFDAWRDSRTLEPLLVRPRPDERNVFEVIVGIERWHAARRAHIREVPVLVHDASDEDAIRLAMSARLKRGPLSPLAEAGIYLSLMSEAGMSTEQIARMVGKPPAHVATMVRVLNLPRTVRNSLERGEITALHARALLDAPNAEALAREVVARRLDIYQTEQLVRTASLKAERAEKVDIEAVDLDLSDGEYEDVRVDAATLDGETGFGPEARFARESFDAAREAAASETRANSDEEPLVDETDDTLIFDDVPEDSLDLIDAPEIEAAAITFAGPPATTDGPEMPAAKSAEPKAGTPGDPEMKPAGKERPDGQAEKKAETPPPPGAKKGVVTTELLEHHLSHLLGLKVAISEWHNMGVISIHYTNREELGDVVSRLNSGSPR